MIICKICNNEIPPTETPLTIEGIPFHSDCFNEVSETYRKSRTLQKVLHFAFKKLRL